MGLGKQEFDINLWKLEFSYGTWSGGTLDTTKNNGALAQQKITVPTAGANTGFTAIQTYGYDALNRLTSATETISSTQTWKQEFTYDRYGNKNYVTGSGHTTTLGSCTTADCNPTISTSTNRITSSGYSYDYAGSITQNSAGERFAYDAEDHQISYFNALNGGSTPDASYIYDGDGKRVRKTASGFEDTVFLYDAEGTLIEERNVSTGAVTNYVYAGSQLISTETASGTSYITADHLGSTRVVTDGSGNIIARKDYGAFGDETITPERITGLGYNPPGTRKDYTGYEKDSESGLEFAQARYENTVHGRFTSVDPLTASATIRDPQTLNRYTYAANSPYKFTDPLGLRADSLGDRQCRAAECSSDYGDDDESTSQEAAFEQNRWNDENNDDEVLVYVSVNVGAEALGGGPQAQIPEPPPPINGPDEPGDAGDMSTDGTVNGRAVFDITGYHGPNARQVRDIGGFQTISFGEGYEIGFSIVGDDGKPLTNYTATLDGVTGNIPPETFKGSEDNSFVLFTGPTGAPVATQAAIPISDPVLNDPKTFNFKWKVTVKSDSESKTLNFSATVERNAIGVLTVSYPRVSSVPGEFGTNSFKISTK